jgi:thiol:disulfide interchange protein
MLARTAPRKLLALLAASLCVAASSGCRSSSKRAGASSALPSSAQPTSAIAGKPHFVRWPRSELPLEQFVQREVERAETEHGSVMVYVGATWCEPCQHFHQAVEHGELDPELAGTRFLEFDVDQDRSQLTAAGYRSKYVPLFAIPDPDGRASGRMIEGSVKGPKAVRDDLLPRLRKLLGNAGP